MENHDSAIVSRRSFLAGTAATVAAVGGFLEVLPSVPGGYLAPVSGLFKPGRAYAVDSDDAWFTFTVVGKDEVGIHIVDVANKDEGGNFVPVPRAKVTLTSRADSSKIASGETDENGKVILKIGDMAMLNKDGSLVDSRYQCNVNVDIDSSNCRPEMRDLHIGLLHIDGASGIVIGTHMLEGDDDVYVERMGFDDWDILYTKNVFMRSSENNIEHWITVRIKGLAEAPSSMPTIGVAFYDVDEKEDKSFTLKVDKQEYDKDKKQWTGMFTGHFLELSDDWPEHFNNDEVELTLKYTNPADKKLHKLKTILRTKKAAVKGSKYDEPLIPFLTSMGSLGSISAGNNWPCFNNANISIINFNLPLHLYPSFSSFVLCVGDAFAVKDDKGLHSPNEWKDQATKSVEDRFKKTQKDYLESIEHLGERKPYRGDNDKELGHKWGGKFSIHIILQGFLGVQWDDFSGEGTEITKLAEGKAGAGFGVDVKGSVSFKFTIGPVPFYITLTLGCEVMFAGIFKVTGELVRDEYVNVNNFEWVPNGSLSINIKPSLKLSVGVGIEGAICASISGKVSLPMFIGWFEAKPDDEADPSHFTVGYSFVAELSVQCFCFCGSVSIWSIGKDPFYDNWRDRTPDLPEATRVELVGDTSKARFLHTLPDGTKGYTSMMADDGRMLAAADDDDIFASMLPVTMEDMGASYEAEAVKPKTKLTYPEEVLPTVQRDTIPMVVELEDGTLTTQFVPCKGVNTFTFEDELPDTVVGLTPMTAAAVPLAAAAGADDMQAAADVDLFDGDLFLGFGAAPSGEYEYKAVEGKTTGARCDTGGVKAIADYDGIKPTVDVVIYDQVFSDPRQRIVDIGGVPHLFRIMTVDYSFGGTSLRRPRVVYSKFDLDAKTWGEPTVIEYGTGTNALKHIDIFDYDFDIVVRSAGYDWTRHVQACMIITGGIRPQGDNTSIYSAFATPTVTVLMLDENMRVYQRMVKQASELYNDGLAHMVSVPRIRDGFALKGASGSIAFAFLHRKAKEAKQLMTTAATASFGFGFCYVRDGAMALMMNTNDSDDPKEPTVVVDPIEIDKTVTSMDIVVGEGVDGKYDALLTLLFYKTQGYEVCSAVIPCGKSFADVVVRRNIVSSATLPQLKAWPGHGTFLFTKNRDVSDEPKKEDYYLYSAAYDPEVEGQKGFEENYERVDFNGFKGSSFAVSPTGKYLFYYESFVGSPGDDIVPDPNDATKAIHKEVYVELYRIMASRFLNGKFSEDFPFAELDSPIDDFEVMDITDDASTFLATEITDADHALGRLRYIAVPNTLAAEIEGFAELDSFVCAGSSCTFQIDIRNHGNLIIGGFDVAMFDPDLGVRLVDTFTAQTIDPERVLTTANSRRPWMDEVEVPEESVSWVGPSSEDDMAVQDDETAIREVMPGEVLSYRIELDIPDDWEGKKDVIVRLTNIWSPGIQVAFNEPLSITPDEPVSTTLTTSVGPVALHLHKGVNRTLEVQSVEATAELVDPIEEVEEDNPEPTPEPEPTPTPKPDNGKPLPSTGDALPSILAPLGVALGAAGALFGAYSMRRTAIEQEQAMIEADNCEIRDADE